MKKKNREDSFCVYIGPSIKGLIQNGAVFRGKKQDAVKLTANVIEQFPTVEKLIVADLDLPTARLKVNQSGTLLHKYQQELLADTQKM